MKLHENPIWLDDLEEIILKLPELSIINNKTVLVTGATGLIGTAVVELLLRYNELFSGNIQICVAGRSIESLLSRFGDSINDKKISYILFDATQYKNDFDIKADYIIYGASNAIPNYVVKEPVETMLCNFLGLKSFLDYAKDNKIKRLLYISSSEVYGEKYDNLPFVETDYGYIDHLKPRSSYAEGKRAAETLCMSYGYEYNVDIVIVRPGHIYGPTALKRDTRVSSAWVYDVAMGNDIIMKSDGAQVRSYCHCLDCASAIIKTLVKGEKLQAYNISNENSIFSVKRLAELLCDISNTHLRFEKPNDTERKQFNPMNVSSLDSKKIHSLGWRGLFDGKKGLSHTIEIIKEIDEVI